MEQREPRKRIKYEPKGVPALQDDLEFKRNKCSDHARRVFIEFEKICIELWFDKHYHNRHQFGDEVGKREGISPNTVEALVRRSLKHLLFYSAVVAGFKFVNWGTAQPFVRVILQEGSTGPMLNVVIEAHFLDIDIYEMTVKTAMCVDDFRIAMGQHCIEIQGNNSILKRKDNKHLIEICSN